jgi:copper chaperone NosL
MFKFVLNHKKWAPHITIKGFKTIFVTDYYLLERFDARKAVYVIGSDVLGPMGHELIPLRTKEEALEFMKDHHGKKIVRFDEVTELLLEDLDKSVFK